MPVVWIPSLIRELTGGAEQVTVEGQTLRQVIECLDAVYPGFRARVLSEEGMRPGLAVAVDGVVAEDGLRTPVEARSEIHFVTAISGG